ncbi:uncharacterized protein LOC105699204 [Orussus abietinus]|uniref:uncharacterized protein LOC105699204 n=1 Tax=Orussus abietinus TaxID=222816 RepID=UPI0006256364|nr:uncharacterized protein LOC105699204 [Orussus abietinus]
MAIMQSCCCWRSVRRGSFASAIFTGFYFALVAVMTGTLLYDEQQYLIGNRSLPESPSVLEPDTISPTTIRFNIAVLTCSCCGVLSSLLLLYGLLKDQLIFLVPWIVAMVAFIAVDLAHTMYLLFFTEERLTPIKAMVFTLNFFLVCLHIYSLLCVISQCQEYLMGRGTATDDCEYRVPAVRYTVPPTTTATSCLSSRRAATNNETRETATATPTQSPTTAPAAMSEKSPNAGKSARKHVQFPDTTSISQTEKSDTGGIDITTKWTPETELGKSEIQLAPGAVDTAPLLSSPTIHQSSPAGTKGGDPQS